MFYRYKVYDFRSMSHRLCAIEAIQPRQGITRMNRFILSINRYINR